MSAKSGFTLIELLVVITIMALVGAYALSNFGSFGKDQKLKNDALDVLSLLRLAQSNATSGLKCQSQPALNWRVEFTDTSTIDLKCQYLSGANTITSSSIKSESPAVSTTLYGFTAGSCASTPTYVSFAPLYGTMTSDCGSYSITITVGGTKQVIIDPGGKIYVQ